MSAKDGIVQLWDLPDSVYIDFKPKFRRKLLETLRLISPKKNWYTIAKLLYPDKKCREGFNLIVAFVRRDKKASLKLIKRISEIMTKSGYKEFSLADMEKQVNRMSSDNPAKEITNPKLPFNFNRPDGTRFISAIIHDGGITKQLNPFYVNFDNNLRKLVKASAMNIFGDISGEIESKANELSFPKIIGEILTYGLGLPSGRKIYSDPHIPEFIFNAKIESKISFIRQAFDDEGCVGNKYIEFVSAGISQAPKLIEDIRKIIKSLGINTTKISSPEDYFVKGGEKHRCYRFFITGRMNLIRYYKIISFNKKEKLFRLENIINNYKQWQVGRNKAINNALWNAANVELENGSITTKNLITTMRRSYSQVSWCLKELSGLGLINKIKEPEATKNGRTFTEFKLTEEGWKKMSSSANICEYEYNHVLH